MKIPLKKGELSLENIQEAKRVRYHKSQNTCPTIGWFGIRAAAVGHLLLSPRVYCGGREVIKY